VNSPMLCQQCGNAPCRARSVPVFAAHQRPTGQPASLNRCVGTRYCSNQLPVQGPLLQLVSTYAERDGEVGSVARAAVDAAQSGCHGGCWSREKRA